MAMFVIRPSGLSSTQSRRGGKGSEFVIFGDGEDQRDFIPVGVASRQISALLELDESPSVVNIARGTSHTLNEVIKMIEDNTNRSIAVAYRERDALATYALHAWTTRC